MFIGHDDMVVVQGARKTCYSQYKETEVRTFIEQFWDLSKADQDSLVPPIAHGLMTPPSNCF